MSKQPELDAVTGVETTGHEWDGIKELNKPLPRWWLNTFYVCILWAVGYWMVYPAWPTLNGYTPGLLGYSQRETLAREAKAATQAQGGLRDLLARTPLADVRNNPELLRFATAGGTSSFQTNCAPCHGRGAQGAVGYPNLNDDDWLWGGSVEDIHKTIEVGIRTEQTNTRLSQMPRFGVDKLLSPEEIAVSAEFVLALSGQAHDAAAAAKGGQIYSEQCAACHGETGKGNTELGSPNLTDRIWLYGGSKQEITESIQTGRGGMMPAWARRLDPVTMKAIAVYVHNLGGGK